MDRSLKQDFLIKDRKSHSPNSYHCLGWLATSSFPELSQFSTGSSASWETHQFWGSQVTVKGVPWCKSCEDIHSVWNGKDTPGTPQQPPVRFSAHRKAPFRPIKLSKLPTQKLSPHRKSMSEDCHTSQPNHTRETLSFGIIFAWVNLGFFFFKPI